MNREELDQLFKTNTEYNSIIEESNSWFENFKSGPNDQKSKRAADYIMSVIGILEASEEALTGIFEDEEDKPKYGSSYNKEALDLYREFYLSINYRIALVNREVHSIINNIKFTDTPYDEVLDTLAEKENEFLKPGYIPQYLIDLNIKFDL